MKSARWCSIAVVPLIAVIAACGATPTKEKPTMTPDQARTHLIRDINVVLHAATSDEVPDLDSSGLSDGIPCGGLEGTDDSKVEHHIGMTPFKITSAPKAAVTSMWSKLRELGYDGGVETLDDYEQITFFDRSGGGDILVYSDGLIMVSAGTECLDNPDQ